MVIAFLGPDGSGKSTLISSVNAYLNSKGYIVKYFHLRPGFFKNSKKQPNSTVTPHLEKPRNKIVTFLKLCFFIFDYWTSYLFLIWPSKFSKKIFIFDRHFYDILVDPKRYRCNLPTHFILKFCLFIPSPNVTYILDAHYQTIRKRCTEVNEVESERQMIAYRELVKLFPKMYLISAEQEALGVFQDVKENLSQHESI